MTLYVLSHLLDGAYWSENKFRCWLFSSTAEKLPHHSLLSERWTDEIILMVKLHRKTINWRRSIIAFNEVVVCVIPRRNPASALRLPEWKWINVCVCVCRFYRSDGESPAESSSEPLFSVNNSGTSRTRGSDRPGWEPSVTPGIFFFFVILIFRS